MVNLSRDDICEKLCVQSQFVYLVQVILLFYILIVLITLGEILLFESTKYNLIKF